MIKYYKVHPAYWEWLNLMLDYYDEIIGHMPVDLSDMLEADERQALVDVWDRVQQEDWEWEAVEDE